MAHVPGCELVKKLTTRRRQGGHIRAFTPVFDTPRAAPTMRCRLGAPLVGARFSIYRAARVRLSSHSLDWREIQSHASETELNRPISSIALSAHSTSTCQNTPSAVLVSRGLKIGLPQSGKPVFTLVARCYRGTCHRGKRECPGPKRPRHPRTKPGGERGGIAPSTRRMNR